MATFKEANDVRISMKMKLSNYAWYNGSTVTTTYDGYGVIINVKKLDNTVRKIISPVVSGIQIKIESE